MEGAQTRFAHFGLDTHTALAFLLAEKHLAHLLPKGTLRALKPYFTEAKKALGKAAGRPIGEWDKRVHFSQRGISPKMPDVPAAVDTVVMKSLAEGKRIRATYEKHDGTVKDYVLSPLGLLSKGNILYLIAKPERVGATSKETPRSFALHRVRSATETEEPCTSVPGFDLARLDREGAFGISIGTERLKVVLRVKAQFARSFRDLVFGDEQKILEETETHVIVSFVVPNTLELRWWIAGYGARCEVIEPESLQKDVEKLLRSG